MLIEFLMDLVELKVEGMYLKDLPDKFVSNGPGGVESPISWHRFCTF